MARNSARPDLGQGGPLEQLDRYPVTFGVVFACLLLFGFCATRAGGFAFRVPTEVLIDLGANVYPVTLDQPWRLLTAAFLHADAIHLAFNMVAMFILGRTMELHYGSARTWVIFVACCLSGTLTSCLAQSFQGSAAGIGASGGVFGLLLCAFVYANQHPARLGSVAQQLRGWIVFALVFSFFVPNVDHPGHAGGAGLGALIGWQLQPAPGKDPHPLWTPLAHVLAVLCLVSFGLIAFSLRRAGMA